MDLVPSQPCIGYIGFANNDNPERLERVRNRFGGLGAKVAPLLKEASVSEAEAWIGNLDAIYVGGGHTFNLLQHWKLTGIDRVILAAAHRGMLVAGVSAGATCWFDIAFWDGGETVGYQPLAGLGLFPGSCCPHYTTEPKRAATYRHHIASQIVPDGFAIGDGAGLLIEHGRAPLAIEARENTGVWRIEAPIDQADMTQAIVHKLDLLPHLAKVNG
jgi:dipeptidase E